MHLQGAAGPSQLVCQTSLMICSRRKTTPGRWARRARRSNSLRVSWTLSPSTLTRRVGSSMVTEPSRSRVPSVVPAPVPVSSGPGLRRLTAWMRARSSPVVGLDDVVVGAEVEPVDPGAHVPARGHHDHRGGGELPDAAADLVAVLVGQAEVEQDHPVRGALAVRGGQDGLERLLAVAGVGDGEAVLREDRGEGGGDVVVVLHEQQSHAYLLRDLPWSLPRPSRRSRCRARRLPGLCVPGGTRA